MPQIKLHKRSNVTNIPGTFPIGRDYIYKIQRFPITFNIPSNIEELNNDVAYQDIISGWKILYNQENTITKTVLMKRGGFLR